MTSGAAVANETAWTDAVSHLKVAFRAYDPSIKRHLAHRPLLWLLATTS